jgi:hypothetical protein
MRKERKFTERGTLTTINVTPDETLLVVCNFTVRPDVLEQGHGQISKGWVITGNVQPAPPWASLTTRCTLKLENEDEDTFVIVIEPGKEGIIKEGNPDEATGNRLTKAWNASEIA